MRQFGYLVSSYWIAGIEYTEGTRLRELVFKLPYSDVKQFIGGDDNKTMRKLTNALSLGFGVLAMLAASGVARADATLDFQLGGAGGGSITYTQKTGILGTGTSVPVRSVTGNNTPANDGQTLNITATTTTGTGKNKKTVTVIGALSFTTVAGTYSGATDSLDFGSGGNFTILGDIQSLGLVATPTPVLLQGSFLSAVFQSITVGKSTTDTFTGSGPVSTTNSALATYYGLTNPNTIWSFVASINGGSTSLAKAPTKNFSVTPVSVDVIETAVVPEPTSLLLFGSLLACVALIYRRRNAANNN